MRRFDMVRQGFYEGAGWAMGFLFVAGNFLLFAFIVRTVKSVLGLG